MEGFELALNLYADWCASTSACTFGDSRDAVISTINSFLRGAGRQPPAGGGPPADPGKGGHRGRWLPVLGARVSIRGSPPRWRRR